MQQTSYYTGSPRATQQILARRFERRTYRLQADLEVVSLNFQHRQVGVAPLNSTHDGADHCQERQSTEHHDSSSSRLAIELVKVTPVYKCMLVTQGLALHPLWSHHGQVYHTVTLQHLNKEADSVRNYLSIRLADCHFSGPLS